MAVIITDSTCDLPLQELEKLGVDMISLRVNFGDESFADKREITDEEFYARLEKSEALPTTTLLSIGEYMERFERYPDEEIVVLTISSKLSGTCQSALAAAEMSKRSDIYVVDSLNVTGGLALLVRLAVSMRDAGKSGQEIAQSLDAIKGRVRIFAMIDTLKYLVKGGRLSGVSGAIGSVLGIKPIISVQDGVVHNLSKTRGVPAAIAELKRLILEEHPFDPSLPFQFVHTNNAAALDQLAAALGLEDSGAGRYMIGSTVGTHAGPGAIGFCYFEKE